MDYYRHSAKKVLEELSATEDGLTSAQAQERMEKYGLNKLAEAKKPSVISLFLKELTNPMILVLLAAAAVSAVTAIISHESLADVFIILAVVVLNGVLGVVQESKAEKALEALQNMAAATSKVMRDGRLRVLRSDQLVPGDIILLEAGDSVPADGRLIESASLQIEESALTGESVPVYKDTAPVGEDGGSVPLGDRKNSVYMSGTVVYGRGKAVVTETGMNTEMGKIAGAISAAKEGETPLQKKLAQLSKTLSFAVIGVCIFIFGFSAVKELITDGVFHASDLLNTFMIAVSLAVAAIPEGLATVVTVVLSIGVTKMARRNAIIRRLTAVETLGCAQVICSDKTGTLTQNRMTVVDHYASDEGLLATAMTLCSDAEPDENGIAVGEPTECALVNYATGLGISKKALSEKLPRIAEAPFDSVRKLMTTLHRDGDRVTAFTKGAPDELITRCTRLFENGEVTELTEEKRRELLNINKSFADRALRVLAAAYRVYPSLPEDVSPENLENDLIFIGFCGMIDPVRPEVVSAIESCRTAGIIPVMITGDHRDTAVAIARELGIISDPSQAITGTELDGISDDDLRDNIEHYRVYARVRPEHKVRVVNAWRERGYIVAMTGDGVNDAPSIKSADIGIGMGITGTDVTKNVADMVLADDNFATIVGAVGEGRRIYGNIRKTVQFLLSSNLAEVAAVFVSTVMGFTLLKPVHILWVNLITDCFPALALGTEASDEDIMARPPRDSDESIFGGGVGINTVIQGVLIALLTLVAYFIGDRTGDGMTAAFITLSTAEIFHAFNMRSLDRSIFKLKKQNLLLGLTAIGAAVLTAAVVFVPFLRNVFSFTEITVRQYALFFALSAVMIPAVELSKLISSAVKRKVKK